MEKQVSKVRQILKTRAATFVFFSNMLLFTLDHNGIVFTGHRNRDLVNTSSNHSREYNDLLAESWVTNTQVLFPYKTTVTHNLAMRVRFVSVDLCYTWGKRQSSGEVSHEFQIVICVVMINKKSLANKMNKQVVLNLRCLFKMDYHDYIINLSIYLHNLGLINLSV